MNSDKLSLQPRNNHMAMLGAFGVLPGEAYGIDRAVMNATMHAVWELWEWESTWSCAPTLLCRGSDDIPDTWIASQTTVAVSIAVLC